MRSMIYVTPYTTRSQYAYDESETLRLHSYHNHGVRNIGNSTGCDCIHVVSKALVLLKMSRKLTGRKVSPHELTS